LFKNDTSILKTSFPRLDFLYRAELIRLHFLVYASYIGISGKNFSRIEKNFMFDKKNSFCEKNAKIINNKSKYAKIRQEINFELNKIIKK